MRPSDELFRLIKSMSKPEKIYFKRYSKRHILGYENKYVKLFDMIEKQNGEYDEDKVLASFKGDRFVKQIHVAKNYLFDLILKSLTDFHSNKDDDFMLYESVMKIKVLLERDMLKTANKLIKKAAFAAASRQNYLMQYLLLDYESMMASKKYTGKAQEELEKINRKKDNTIKQIDNLEKYKSINSVLNLLMARWSYSRNPKDVKAVKKILNDPIIKNENKAVEFNAKYELYFIKTKVFRFLQNDSKALEYRLKLVELMEEYPETIEINPEKYVAKLHDFINYCLSTETGAARAYPVQDYLAKLRKHMEIVNSRTLNAKIKSLCWYYYYQMQIGYNYTSLNKDGFYSTMSEVNKQIDIHKNHLRVRYLLNFYYYCSIAYFEFENYEESLKWHTRFLNHKEASIYEEIYHTALIFSIILHYELKNFELAEFLIINTKRYYRKEEKLYESEKVILSYIKKLLSTDNNEDVSLLYKQLHKELKKLSQMDSEKRFLNAFNFERWISKNIEKLK